MELSEKHHAQIIAAFHTELQAYGRPGLAVFTRGAQQYGEERGRRMALRALRDKRELDFLGYFAYSEWEATPGFYDISMRAEAGTVYEKVTKCPWAFVFADMGKKECGVLYCREIDRAIVRGFNPELCLELLSTQHLEGCCSFQFKHKDIDEALLTRADEIKKESGNKNILPMSYHCAHVYSVFSRLISDIYGKEGNAVISRANHAIGECLGTESMKKLYRYETEDFTRLPEGKV